MLMSFISIEIPVFKENVKINFNLMEGLKMLFILLNTMNLCLIGDASLCGDVLKLLVNIKTLNL